MREYEQREVQDLGAATELTQGVYWPPFEESVGMPDYFD